MCGFIGCVDTRGPVDARRLVDLRERLQHRGPDDAGLWIEGSMGLAHRRLSIIDLNSAGHQPMVSHCGRTQHTELQVSEREAVDVVAKLPNLMDEPSADASSLPTYLVSTMARRHVTVALSGDGGDELAIGYVRYQWAERIARRILPISGGLRRAAASVCASPLLTGSIGRLPTPRWLGRPAPLGAKLQRFGDLIAGRGCGICTDRVPLA